MAHSLHPQTPIPPQKTPVNRDCKAYSAPLSKILIIAPPKALAFAHIVALLKVYENLFPAQFYMDCVNGVNYFFINHEIVREILHLILTLSWTHKISSGLAFRLLWHRELNEICLVISCAEV